MTVGLTAFLAEQVHHHAPLTDDDQRIVRHSLLDYAGVTIAGAAERTASIVGDEFAATDSAGVTLFGRPERVGLFAAALVNGTAAHALDYDDVNMAIPGHPAAAIFPALLALAEDRRSTGAEVVVAYAAGYDVMCRLGRAMTDEHYDRGFHATATLGTFGAAAACARLMGLDTRTTAHAFGIAATQAAGLKSMFGTMSKPFNAGRAASGGLLAARLAARGLEAREDAIEAAEGFAALYGSRFEPHAAFAGAHLPNNLFKHHAACYLVHAAIECVAKLRGAWNIASVGSVTVEADASLANVCNIRDPQNANEARFSLRAAVALALLGRDTADPATFDRFPADADVHAALPLIAVKLRPGMAKTASVVTIVLDDGRAMMAVHDAGVPAADLDGQERRLRAKFAALTAPMPDSSELAHALLDIGECDDVAPLLRRCAISAP